MGLAPLGDRQSYQARATAGLSCLGVCALISSAITSGLLSRPACLSPDSLGLGGELFSILPTLVVCLRAYVHVCVRVCTCVCVSDIYINIKSKADFLNLHLLLTKLSKASVSCPSC